MLIFVYQRLDLSCQLFESERFCVLASVNEINKEREREIILNHAFKEIQYEFNAIISIKDFMDSKILHLEHSRDHVFSTTRKLYFHLTCTVFAVFTPSVYAT